MYIICSKTDEEFNVKKNVIDASTLLKNICEHTAVSKPINVDCSSFYLKKFITLANNFDNTKDFTSKFKEFEDIEMLVEMVKDLGILDSDILLDFVADVILQKVKHMDWRKLNYFFQFEEAFEDSERLLIEKNILEFFLSNYFERMKFPFEGTSFSTLKNKFYTPMNVLLARIIERADCKLAFEFSVINKTLKNENDRHPLKPERFFGSQHWTLKIRSTNYDILPKKKNEEYFSCIKNRKMIAREGSTNLYFDESTNAEDIKRLDSLNFFIANKDSCLWFHTSEINKDKLYAFDMENCPFKYINFQLEDVTFGFQTFFDKFIAKDFSRKIKIFASPFFDIFDDEEADLVKKRGETKFCEVEISSWNCSKPCSKFKEFILNYMDEENGIVMGNYRLFPQIEELERHEYGSPSKFVYTVSQALVGFKIMELRKQSSTDFKEYPEDRSLSPLCSP